MTDSNILDVPSITRDDRLAGKVAVVTGGGSAGELAGSGAAIAVLFAAKGAHVAILDRSVERGENTRRAIVELGGSCQVIGTDITKGAGCARATDEVVSQNARIDILVNNAAIAPVEADGPPELWDDILNLNLKAAKLMSDAVLPHMQERGSGSIVNIASTAAFRGGAGIIYSASKNGLIGLTTAMAFAYGRSGIRFNCIAPGHVHTPMGSGLDSARRLRIAAGVLDSEGTAWDVAYAALFLASDESRWVTAHTLPVDAGSSQMMPLRIFPRIFDAAQAAPESLTSLHAPR